MTERWVSNASPLILLAAIGQANLLTQLADEVVTTSVVAAEIQAGPEDDAARRWLVLGQLQIVAEPAPTSELLAWDLGGGETSVLAYALSQPGWVALLDDAAARRCALSLGVPVKGTLAVVVLAKQRGLIPSAAVCVQALRQRGFRIDDDLVREVLARAVQEDWPPS